MADLPNVFAVRAELENLRCGGAIGWAGGVAPREDEHMLLRVHRDTRSLAQIQIRWKLQEIGNRFEGDLRDLLRSQVIAERDSSAKYNGEGPIARHDKPPHVPRATISNPRGSSYHRNRSITALAAGTPISISPPITRTRSDGPGAHLPALLTSDPPSSTPSLLESEGAVRRSAVALAMPGHAAR